MQKIIFVTVLALVLGAQGARAQSAPPGTDIYLVALEEVDGKMLPGKPVNITRRPGYDNQPCFVTDALGILFVSMDTTGQTDVYRYNLETKSTAQVTNTAESEYSPTPMHGAERFSVVRVEADRKQRLWSFTMAGDEPQLLLERVEPVGYHAWGDDHTVLLFILGDVFTLLSADTGTGQARELAAGIGRSLHKIPGQPAISFTQKIEETWWIRRYELHSGEITSVVEAIDDSQDYCWFPDGRLLMGQGSVLYVCRAGGEDWFPAASFTSQGLQNITRLAVSPDAGWLALVAEDPPGY